MPHSIDPLVEEFLQDFMINYDPFMIPPDETNNVERLRLSTSPLSFYDWHVASHLTLEKTIYCPSIVQSFSKIYDAGIKNLLRHNYNLSCDHFPHPLSMYSGSFNRIVSVKDHYNDKIAEVCHPFASKLVLHPFHEPWDSPFFMGSTESSCPLSYESYLTWSDTAESGKYLSDIGANRHLLEISRNKILQLSNKYPRLATFSFFLPTDSVMRMFKTVTKSSSFHWTAPKTIGRRTVSYITPPPDGNLETIIPMSKKLKSRSSVVFNGNKKTRTAKKIIPSKPSGAYPSRPDLRQHIQRAWTECVINDSSFFVLNCGRYERIGFRHRASQTLYLSGVIDTVNAQQPVYRKIHVGLFMAIIQDAIRRQEAEESLRTTTGKKRSAGLVGGRGEPAKKKQKKVEKVKDSSDGIRINEILLLSNLALIELNYGIYCSPTPSSFFRVGARQIFWRRCEAFEGDDYFTLTLQASSGFGAIGVVHPATVEATTMSGEILRRSDMIVKLAFKEDQQEKLEEEYRIYRLLKARGVVEGIVPVYGLFKDSETGTLALLMDHAGNNLLVRQSKLGITLPDRRVHTSAVEKEAFQRVLKSMHSAGILHGDIRQENLLIGPDNKVFIIDFDRASDTTIPIRQSRLSVSEELSRETYKLQRLLEVK